MNSVCKVFTAGLAAALVILSGCGGGGAGGDSIAGIGGTGKTISGGITGFGSIYVNGVEHFLDSATIEVDDSIASENDLRIGMVVTLNSEVSGLTGTANSVTYDNAVEGPVSNILTGADGLTRTFSVLGVDVSIDATGTSFDDSTPGFSFDSIANNDVVSISGFFDGSGVLNASYIDKEGTFPGFSQVELKGIVSNAGGGAGPGDNFTVNGINITILAGADLSDIPGALVTNGMFVEVKGDLASATQVNASAVELESEGIGEDGDEVSLEGLVSGFSGSLSSFLVAGQPVDASSASFEPTGLQLENGLKVEVEGRISGATLIAEEIEARAGEIKVHATVNSIAVTNASNNEGSITLNLANSTLVIMTDSRTTFEDETGVDTSPPLKLNEIGSGDFLELSGFLNGATVSGTEIHRKSPDDVILQGPVDSVVSGSSITILGVTFNTDGSTQFEEDDDNALPGGSATFYSVDRTGDEVKIKDNAPGDGTADEVDLED
jgi:Domain of unknown function (DUF5666)